MARTRATAAALVVVVLGGGLTACDKPVKKAPAKLVASAPTAEQVRQGMRDWLDDGGSKVMASLEGDLLAATGPKGVSDPFLAKGVAASITKDLVAAHDYRPFPDDQGQVEWVRFLDDMANTGLNLSESGGGLKTAGDPTDLAEAVRWTKVAQTDLNGLMARFKKIDADLVAKR